MSDMLPPLPLLDLSPDAIHFLGLELDVGDANPADVLERDALIQAIYLPMAAMILSHGTITGERKLIGHPPETDVVERWYTTEPIATTAPDIALRFSGYGQFKNDLPRYLEVAMKGLRLGAQGIEYERTIFDVIGRYEAEEVVTRVPFKPADDLHRKGRWHTSDLRIIESIAQSLSVPADSLAIVAGTAQNS